MAKTSGTRLEVLPQLAHDLGSPHRALSLPIGLGAVSPGAFDVPELGLRPAPRFARGVAVALELDRPSGEVKLELLVDRTSDVAEAPPGPAEPASRRHDPSG